MKQVMLWNTIIEICLLKQNKKKRKHVTPLLINPDCEFLSKQVKMSKLTMMKLIYNILLLKKGVISSVMSIEVNNRHYI